MAVHIRLRRIGKNPKKRPYFRVSVFDERRNRDGTFLEEIGFYDPTKHPAAVKVNKERYDFWIRRGAVPSNTVKSLIKNLQKGGEHAKSAGS
jgi:small subunit ribosomal protein S16